MKLLQFLLLKFESGIYKKVFEINKWRPLLPQKRIILHLKEIFMHFQLLKYCVVISPLELGLQRRVFWQQIQPSTQKSLSNIVFFNSFTLFIKPIQIV